MKAIIQLLRDDPERTPHGQFIVPCTDVLYDEESETITISPSSKSAHLILQCNCDYFGIRAKVMKETKSYVLHSEIYHFRVQITRGKAWKSIGDTVEFGKCVRIVNPIKFAKW